MTSDLVTGPVGWGTAPSSPRILVVAISFRTSYMRPKIIMSEYVVPQWLFIDIETDDIE